MITLADILTARARLGDTVMESPCPRSEVLSARLNCELYFKLENLQRTGSFKDRGALNRLAQLSPEDRARGVVAASAGNHAQGVAFVAQRIGARATIVMPEATPLIKVTSTRSFGAEVVLHGESFDDAVAEAKRRSREDGLVFVPAFDDDAVIAGQGTVGLEIVEQVPDVQVVVTPIGGGGLAGGLGLAIKSLRPEVQVFGVQTSAVPSMSDALAHGAPELLPPARTLADGIAVRRVAERTLELARRYVDRIVLVDEEEIAEAILMLLEVEKTVAEGAGATPLAALLQGQLPIEGKKVVAVISGGNIDVRLLSRIIDRGLVKSGRLMRVRVVIPDVPGALAQLLQMVATTRANLLQVEHDRLAARMEPGLTTVEMVLETRDFSHVDAIETAITEQGWVIVAP